MGSIWTLLAFGFVGGLVLSVLVGLAIGAILGQISREVSQLLEFEPSGRPDRTTHRWTSAPTWSASYPSRSTKHA